MTPFVDTTDTVSIICGSVRLTNWQSVSITRSCELLPNHFRLEASANLLTGSALQATSPDQPCKVYIGSDLVISGWIDRRTIRADGENHAITVLGRGLTRNLVDCSIDIVSDQSLQGGFISESSALSFASRLSKSYGIECVSPVADPGPPIPAFQVALRDTPYEAIERVCRYAAFLPYEDENGRLVLDRVGTRSMASGFSMPGNIESISADRSVDHRYSKYVVVWGGVFQLGGLAPINNQTATVTDSTVQGGRLLIIESEQTSPAVNPYNNYVLDPNAAALRAQWELATRIGRSQMASITCSSWRDRSGMLWEPNSLVTIDAPGADISQAQWIIGTVTFRKDASGTHADLVLMPPAAYTPDPSPLVLFNNDLLNGPKALSAQQGAAG